MADVKKCTVNLLLYGDPSLADDIQGVPEFYWWIAYDNLYTLDSEGWSMHANLMTLTQNVNCQRKAKVGDFFPRKSTKTMTDSQMYAAFARIPSMKKEDEVHN